MTTAVSRGSSRSAVDGRANESVQKETAWPFWAGAVVFSTSLGSALGRERRWVIARLLSPAAHDEAIGTDRGARQGVQIETAAAPRTAYSA